LVIAVSIALAVAFLWRKFSMPALSSSAVTVVIRAWVLVIAVFGNKDAFPCDAIASPKQTQVLVRIGAHLWHKHTCTSVLVARVICAKVIVVTDLGHKLALPICWVTTIQSAFVIVITLHRDMHT
jgi:hypothetical protein